MTESFRRATEARQHDRHALRNWQTEFKAIFVTEETDCNAVSTLAEMRIALLPYMSTTGMVMPDGSSG